MIFALKQELSKREKQNPYTKFYPDEGDLRRELYQKHLEFFRAGRQYRERCFMAANRIGKTEGAGGYETSLHLTGDYPPWWEGRRFPGPINAWVAGKTNETTRDILQRKLFGKKNDLGSGLIPLGLLDLDHITWKSGMGDLIDTIRVRHSSGLWSTVGVKSFQQGRDAFEGDEKDLIWLDEEPPQDVYGECLIRLATTEGMVMITFTPLEGMSEVVISFMPKEDISFDEKDGGFSYLSSEAEAE